MEDPLPPRVIRGAFGNAFRAPDWTDPSAHNIVPWESLDMALHKDDSTVLLYI